MQKLNYRQDDYFEQIEAFITRTNRSSEVSDAVASILADVEQHGDAAVADCIERFENRKVSADDFRVPTASLEAAAKALDPQRREAILEAIRCVEAFHREGLPRSWTGHNPHGAQVGERWYPIRRVGIYVPAGSVPLVSTIIMTTTLARLAGVPEIAVFTPPARDGQISPQMLAGLHLCGIREVYAFGGAHAVGAMAFGTQSIPRVCKIMGPGNAYVAEAQRQVFGRVGIDLIPGPSEALAIADDSADPRYLAADLIAQAEHGSGREKIYYVYLDSAQAQAVERAIQDQLPLRKHRETIERVLETHTLFLEVPDLEAAARTADFIAPEHLELHVRDEAIDSLIDNITTAGAILCGHDTPTVLGDFTAGPSHTLPTGGAGRFFSGLKITDFMRRSSIVRYEREHLAPARSVVRTFAELEDLDGHGYSMEVRFGDE